MRYGLAALGCLLLVVGAVIAYSPSPVPMADDDASTAHRLQAIAPKQLAIAAMAIGAILIIAGMIIPYHQGQIPNAPYDPERARYSIRTRKRI